MSDLMVKRGERWSAEKHNATVAEVMANTLAPSPDYLLARTPIGTTVTPLDSGGGGFGVPPVFSVKVRSMGQGKFAAEIARGLIGGVEPKIGDTPISQKPLLPFTLADFDAEGQARLYIRCELDHDFHLATLVPVVSAVKLGDAPWFGHCLLGIFVRSGGLPRYERFAFSNKLHLAIQRRTSTGLARNLFVMDA